MQVDHQGAGHFPTDVGTVVLLDQGEREVDARGHARRRVRRAVAHIDGVGLDVRLRVPGGEFARDLPVGGRPFAVQKASGAEDEGAGAHGRDPPGAACQVSGSFGQVAGDRGSGVDVAARHQERVGVRFLGGAGVDGDAHADRGGDVGARRRHQGDPVVGAEQICLTEDLGGAGDVQQFDPVVDENRHPMRAGAHRPILR